LAAAGRRAPAVPKRAILAARRGGATAKTASGDTGNAVIVAPRVASVLRVTTRAAGVSTASPIAATVPHGRGKATDRVLIVNPRAATARRAMAKAADNAPTAASVPRVMAKMIARVLIAKPRAGIAPCAMAREADNTPIAESALHAMVKIARALIANPMAVIVLLGRAKAANVLIAGPRAAIAPRVSSAGPVPPLLVPCPHRASKSCARARRMTSSAGATPCVRR